MQPTCHKNGVAVKLEATRSDSNTCHGWLATLQSMAKEGIGSCRAGGICLPKISMVESGCAADELPDPSDPS